MTHKKLIGLLCSITLNLSPVIWAADIQKNKNELINNVTTVHFTALFLKPDSNNLDYAYLISGSQPYYQSWSSQSIQPTFTPSFELGAEYGFSDTSYNTSVDWLHLNSSNSASTRASSNLDLEIIEFVAPPYEVGPPVFGIQKANSNVAFNLDTVDVNVGKLFEISSHVHTRVFGGLNIIRLNQTLTTVFSDVTAVLATAYTHAIVADPSYSLKTQGVSNYTGVGPDLGLNVAYNAMYGFGFIGEALGSLNVGTLSAQENFTGNSYRLTTTGVGTTYQQITTPSRTQLVPGFDGKLGIFYHYSGKHFPDITIEGGYRLTSYFNAISTVTPATLVQPGTEATTPQFVTGTMAIESICKEDHTFNMNGPYINIKIAVA